MRLLSIGAFARATRLTPKALRLYDELGLLPPAFVDQASGYRFYDPAQLERARLAAPDAAAEDAGYRAALVASQVLGLGMTRYVLELPPLTQVSSDDLVAAIAPNLDRYLSGDLS